MATIKIELWHIITFISLIEIFHEVLLNRKIKPLKGQTIRILANRREWEEVTIIDIKVSIPFFRIGGVTMIHQTQGDCCWFEMIPFENFIKYRFQYKVEAPE